MRRMPLLPTRKVLLPALAASLLLATVPLAVSARSWSGRDFVELRKDNDGYGLACESGTAYQPYAACQNTRAPKLMVWGDSFAMHLVPGLAATAKGGVAQATKSVCAPFLGLAQVVPEYPRPYAEGCISFNDSVLDFLSKTKTVQVVALSSPFYPYFDPQRRLLVREDGKLVDRDPGEDIALAAMRDTVARLRAAGKRVVVVAPPPSSGLDMTHCLERKAGRSHVDSSKVDCNIRLSDYHASKARTLAFLARMEKEADVPVVSFDSLLCTKQSCAVELDGKIVYRDEGHFSHEGSIAVAKRMQLGRMLDRVAR